jgi:hypothetical protein
MPKKKIPIILAFGAVAGIGLILLSFVLYRQGPPAFVGQGAYLSYPIVVVVAAAAAVVEKTRRRRQADGGLLGFRAALRICFGVIVLGLAIQTLFNWLLLNVLDPPFRHALFPVVLARTEAVYRQFKMPEDQIAQAIVDERAHDPFSPARMLLGLARSYIVGFLVALFLAAVIGGVRINKTK